MVLARHLRLWAVALWAACLVGVAVGHAGPLDAPRAAITPGRAVIALQPAADPAVLPGRIAHELRSATQLLPLRTLLVLGVLAGLLGLPVTRWRRSWRLGRDRHALLTRRHAISLRAPPLLPL